MSRRKLQYRKTLGRAAYEIDSKGNPVGQSQLAGNVESLLATLPREDVYATRNAERALTSQRGELGTRPMSEKKVELVERWFEKKSAF